MTRARSDDTVSPGRDGVGRSAFDASLDSLEVQGTRADRESDRNMGNLVLIPSGVAALKPATESCARQGTANSQLLRAILSTDQECERLVVGPLRMSDAQAVGRPLDQHQRAVGECLVRAPAADLERHDAVGATVDDQRGDCHRGEVRMEVGAAEGGRCSPACPSRSGDDQAQRDEPQLVEHRCAFDRLRPRGHGAGPVACEDARASAFAGGGMVRSKVKPMPVDAGPTNLASLAAAPNVFSTRCLDDILRQWSGVPRLNLRGG